MRRFFVFVLTERRDLWLSVGEPIEIAIEQLDEVDLVWNRIADDSIELIEATRERSDVSQRLQVTTYTPGSGDHPELDAAELRVARAETALWLDYKSLFVFADILLGVFVQMSQRAWDAPEGIEHGEGLTAFVRSVERAGVGFDPASPFETTLAQLLPALKAIDRRLGFYRDKFIAHPRTDLTIVSSGTSLSVPLEFHRSHGRRIQPSSADLNRLEKAVKQVEKAEGLRSAVREDADPRDRLRALAMQLEEMKEDASVRTVMNLLREWGMTSPSVVQMAQRLNSVLSMWADRLSQLLARQGGSV